MLYARQTVGTVETVVDRLRQAAREHRFGVLGVIDLKAKMTEKGVPFEQECVILEVCNPGQAKKVLDENMAVSTSLPCRISVYEEEGTVTVATLRPTALLGMYKDTESLADTAKEVEETVVAIIDEAASEERKGP